MLIFFETLASHKLLWGEMKLALYLDDVNHRDVFVMERWYYNDQTMSRRIYKYITDEAEARQAFQNSVHFESVFGNGTGRLRADSVSPNYKFDEVGDFNHNIFTQADPT